MRASGQGVAFIGFMGAGKSHIGMLVAHELRVPFVDTDALIAEQLGSIEQLFAERGEGYFRAIERDVAVTTLQKSLRLPGVVSLGGGAVMSADVREALGRIPHVVWLSAPVEVLFERALEGGRPLARDEAAFCALYALREPLYRSLATATVVNDGSRSAESVAAEVVDLVGAS